mmetsp:Transcript_7124/g.9242  ORF Transcript_7124/g.9242 Transcript_7124/m.9242 type:complete len:473 (+) Transcript_7124:208-1626(+)|eukprot:CAMPEP_0198147472 /NCGR_PEP_ID=MMETSP1443-20131203/35944_1 /TAXON_ID=186043 /ORGANISM="Entomoneis sp., Strain CCMP2396" /LENGTH=472 /DNA_ID=CAMNT_0043811825 /DNA_START=115 /DNA_END=1533 /DNA_ORIENTATION=+
MKLTNPLEDDPVLKDLLKQLERIETRRGFAKWKALFLQQFEMHLEGTNVTKASQKYHSFAKRIDRLAILLKQLEGLIRRGECSIQQCTVKSRKSLSELQKSLADLIEHTEALVPGTLEVEQKAGYTKFDMGAVLVRDGFVEYDRLVICNEILLHMKDAALAKVADRQLLKEMENYWNKVEAFYQIMGNDLGLHGAIMRCRTILRAEDEEFFEYENKKDLHPFDMEGLDEIKTELAESKEKKPKSLYNDSFTDDEDLDDEDEDEKMSEITNDVHSTQTASKESRASASDPLHDLDAKQFRTKKDDWENLREDPPKTAQRHQKVEIYGLDLPLRLIKMSDEASADDTSDVSDYESWCWALELPEPIPKPKEPESEEESEPEPEPEPKPQPKPKVKKAPAVGRDDIDPLTGLSRKLLGLSTVDDDSTSEEEVKPRVRKGYNFNSEGYYHGDAAGWRIASTLRNVDADMDADSDSK